MPHSVARQYDHQFMIDLQEQHKAYHDKTAKDLQRLIKLEQKGRRIYMKQKVLKAQNS